MYICELNKILSAHKSSNTYYLALITFWGHDKRSIFASYGMFLNLYFNFRMRPLIYVIDFAKWIVSSDTLLSQYSSVHIMVLHFFCH